MKNKMRTAFYVLIFVLMVLLPQAAATGIKDALEICMQTVIPSLYPLMFASLLLIRGGSGVMEKMIGKPVKAVFGLPECCAKAFAAAVLGGYPAGAAAVKAMYERGEIDKNTASELSLSAVCAGPAFVIGAVGSGIYSSTAVGAMLLCVQLASVLLVGLIVRLTGRKERVPETRRIIVQPEIDIFVRSASDAARALMNVCTFVTLFGALSGLISALKIDAAVSAVLSSAGASKSLSDAVIAMLMEVSSGSIRASGAGLEAVAFVLGFGGLSVHFQIFSIVGEIGIRKLRFIALRFLQGFICAVLAHFGKLLLPESAVQTAALQVQNAMPSVTGCVCLVIMCLMLLFCMPIHLTKND